jgi:hypothetical protein
VLSHWQEGIMAQTPKEKAFKLLDKYNDPKTTDDQIDRIVTQLYNLGYVIRPLQRIIIKDEVEAKVLNSGSKEWGLVERSTGIPVSRPKSA